MLGTACYSQNVYHYTDHMLMALSPPVSAASQLRQHIATELAPALTQDGTQEVWLTGSVARGVADQFSDIELRVLVDTLDEPRVYETQLRAAGAKVDPVSAVWNGMVTTKSWYRGLFIEAAWQTCDGLAQSLEPILGAYTTDHWSLVEAWHVTYALPLTPAPRLAHWQQRLQVYPHALQTALVEQATTTWTQPHWYPLSPINMWPLAYRDVAMGLSGKLTVEVERCLRLLFAINRVWEPDYKWLFHEQRRLITSIPNLSERVNQIFQTSVPKQQVALCLQLIQDVLECVPQEYDMQRGRNKIGEAREWEKYAPTLEPNTNRFR